MRAMLLMAVGAAVLSLGGCANRPQHGAWCAVFNGDAGPTSCEFATWRQCQATVSGVGGYCARNPYARDDYGPHRRWHERRH